MSFTDSFWGRDEPTKDFIFGDESNQDQLYVTLFKKKLMEPDFEINVYLENEQTATEDNSRSWKVHKGFLKKSEFFNTHFNIISKNTSKFQEENFLKIEWVDRKHFECMSEIIKYFYHTKMHVKVEDFIYCYQIVDYLKIEFLMKKMVEHINATNAVDLLIQCLDIKKKIDQEEMRTFNLPIIHYDRSVLHDEIDGSIDEYVTNLIIQELEIVLSSPMSSELHLVYDPDVFLKIIEGSKEKIKGNTIATRILQVQFTKWLKDHHKTPGIITKSVIVRILSLIDPDYITKDDDNITTFCYLEDKFSIKESLLDSVHYITSRFSKIKAEDLSSIPVNILENIVTRIPQLEMNEKTADKLPLVIFNILDSMKTETTKNKVNPIIEEEECEEEGGKSVRSLTKKRLHLLELLEQNAKFEWFTGETMISMIQRDDMPVDMLKLAMVRKIKFYEKRLGGQSEFLEESESSPEEEEVIEKPQKKMVWDGPIFLGRNRSKSEVSLKNIRNERPAIAPMLSIKTRNIRRIPNHNIDVSQLQQLK